MTAGSREQMLKSIDGVVRQKYVRLLVLTCLLCLTGYGIFYFGRRCSDAVTRVKRTTTASVDRKRTDDDDYPKVEPVLSDAEILRQVPDGAVFRHRLAALNKDPATNAAAYADDVDKGINVVFDSKRDDVPKGARPNYKKDGGDSSKKKCAKK